MKHTRENIIDSIRGIVIILVVFGHSVQFGSGNDYLKSGAFFNNTAFKTIYGFHMPLFMLISGYLFKRTISTRNTSELFTGRIRSLLLPIFAWGAIDLLARLVIFNTISYNNPISFSKEALKSCIYNLWFLWAIFYNSLLVVFIYKHLKNRALYYLVFTGLMLFTPDAINFGYYKFMFPFFAFPFLMGNVDIREWFKNRSASQLSIASAALLAIYSLSVYHWRNDYYIYSSGFTLLGKNYVDQLTIDIIRCGTGFVGTFFALSLMHLIEKAAPSVINNRFLTEAGKSSLGIYILSGFIFSYIVPRVTYGLSFSLINALAMTAAISFATFIVSVGIKRVRLLNSSLLGGRN